MTLAAIILGVAFVLAFPHLIGAGRGVVVGRNAVKSHRQSVKMGVRMGRWQTVIVMSIAVIILAHLS